MPPPPRPQSRHSGVGRNPKDAGAPPAPNGAAHIDRHSGVGRNPEGAGAPPTPQDPADVPLDRFFIRSSR